MKTYSDARIYRRHLKPRTDPKTGRRVTPCKDYTKGENHNCGSGVCPIWVDMIETDAATVRRAASAGRPNSPTAPRR